MIDKGHCKMLHDGESLIEYDDWYDYSTSYPEGEVDLNVLDDTGYELVLPSGAKVGHRSLVRYYRQNLTNDRALVPLKMRNTIQNHYKCFGWVGLSQPEAKKKARDIKFMRQVQQKQWVKLGIKANKIQKKYFRD